jgi:hypothetical protein
MTQSHRGRQRAFDEPIPLPRGRQLVTLKDTENYITTLPEAEHAAAEWQSAMQALILPIESVIIVAQCIRAIRRSSTFFPDLSCVCTQCGCFPRPDQVSAGLSGLRYFGWTFGYGRRAFFWRSTRPLSRAKRRSSSCFSASNFADRIGRISSCRLQSSSTDIIATFLFFTFLTPNPVCHPKSFATCPSY